MSQDGLDTKKICVRGTVPSLSENRSFVIDYEGNRFLKDGQPFQYISGELHYFRVPRAFWRDRLRKCRAAGLNAVSTYVEWSTHEPSPRNYRFEGEEDLEYFLELAQEEDLLVILRPGPYICADREFGGFPPWLLTLYPEIKLRSNDTDYHREVERWFDALLPKMRKYFYKFGGPIIMIQIENGLGCNQNFESSLNLTEHRIFLRELMKSHVQDDVVLFTIDGPGESFLNYGAIRDIYATICLGAGSNTRGAFQAVQQFNSTKGPLVCSEFYLGWYTFWGQEMCRVPTDAILSTMKDLLKINASFNFYMFQGGTNFGFKNGARFEGTYKPVSTSYDYDAPLDEAGDPTPKYYLIRDLIGKHSMLPDIPEPQSAPRRNYGSVEMKYVVSLFNYEFIPDTQTIVAEKPATFEALKVYYGYVLYQTEIPDNIVNPSILDARDLRDRAIVYVNEAPVTVLSRSRNIYKAALMAIPGAWLSLLVENQGRINFGDKIKDEKGLLQAPLLNNEPLQLWKMTTFPFTNVSWVPQMKTMQPSPILKHQQPPAVYYGELVLPQKAIPQNTFIDPTGWGKGIIFVNEYNLGRYWPSAGSQVTLFVPACYLRAAPEKNHIVMVETEYSPRDLRIVFTDKPSIH